MPLNLSDIPWRGHSKFWETAALSSYVGVCRVYRRTPAGFENAATFPNLGEHAYEVELPTKEYKCLRLDPLEFLCWLIDSEVVLSSSGPSSPAVTTEVT